MDELIRDNAVNRMPIIGDKVILKAPLTHEEIDERINCKDASCDVKEWYLTFKEV